MSFEASQPAKEAQQASEESFRLIVDSIPAFAWYASPDGKIEYLNQRILDFTAERQENLVGFGWAKVLHPEDVESTKKAWLHSVETGEPCEVEQRVRRFDNVYRWFRTTAQPVRDSSGRVIRWYGVATEIEDWKRAEEALRASELNFRLIIDSIPGLVHTLTAAGELEFVNQQNLDYFGKPLEELRGWATSSDVIHPDDLPRAVDSWKHTLENGQPDEIECRLRRADGAYRWFQLRCLPLHDSHGRIIRWISLHTDIDGRKRAEEALSASEQSLRLIVDTIPGLVSTTNAAGEPQLFNRQLLEYFGRTPEELKGWATSDLVHPDDLRRVMADNRGPIEAGHPYDFEIRIRRADGVYRWFQVRNHPVRDTEDHVISWHTLLTDIDERKQAEEKLKQSEKELEQIVDSIPQLIEVVDSEGKVLHRNQMMLEYTGWTLEDINACDRSVRILHPDDLQRLLDERQKGFARGVPFDREGRIRRHDGHYRWFLVRYNPLRDEHGNVLRWYATATDIDDRKQAEDRLQLLLDITGQVVSNLQFRDLLRAISAGVRRVMQCDMVGVFLPEPGGNRMQTFVLDFPGSKGFIREEYCSMDGSLGGFVLRSGKPWMGNASDVLQMGLTDEPVIPEGLKTGCMVPLVTRNRVLGLLGLGRREENAFSQADVGFLGQVASQIAIAVENALEYGQITEAKERLVEQKLYLENEIRAEHNFEEIIGNSPKLKAVLQSVRIVAPADSTVLIQGETGTGKEMIARAIHNLSPRKGQAFVKVNCAAIPLGLLESELFGHERGAFTGAIAQKIGRFELAHKGTIFLDEVGDIPLELQPKLLRVLQEQEFERLGSTRTQRVDVRVLAATNVSLTQMVAEKKFRSDLYYRLKVFPIDIPPLRDRREDIPVLVRFFANKYARRMGKQIESVPKETMDALSHYAWPGNIRELQNLMERAALLSNGPSLRVPLAEILIGSGPSAATGGNALQQAEREQIVRALRESNWVVGGAHGAAARLGLKRTSLAYKIQKLRISRPPQ